MDNKEKRIATVLMVLAIVFTIIGSTLAYYSWASAENQKTNVVFTVTAGFTCSGDGGGSITSQEKILAPTSCTNETYAFQREVTTNVTNNRNGSVYMDLWLDVNTIGQGLTDSNNFRYALTEQANDCEHNILAEGTFNGVEDGGRVTLLEGTQYATSDSDTYYLYVWLDAAEKSSSTQNQAFNISLGGECTDRTPLPTLVTTIANDAVMDNASSTFVNNNNGIQFNAISSDNNGKGIYIKADTANNANPIYYYRGAVTNNNVLFANFCWKIVRTTSTGGVKLIYNGLPTNDNKCTNTTAESTRIGTSVFNSSSSSLADVGYMYGSRYEVQSQTMTSISDTYMYGTGYDEVNHRLYTTDAKNFAGTAWGSNYTTLSNNHYTCFNTSGECSPVYYIYATSKKNAYYITIPSGKTIGGILDEMLSNSSNENNSAVKTVIDTWYQNNMTSYTSKLEDTPWCNDRSIYQIGGWSPTGNMGSMLFGPYQRAYATYIPSLTCNTNDAFTLSPSNGNGNLIYPVGLLTADEVMMAGGKNGTGNTSYYLYNSGVWWVSSPLVSSSSYAASVAAFSTTSSTLSNYYGGILNSAADGEVLDVRPSVSLKSGTKVVSGDGTSDTPYVVQ